MAEPRLEIRPDELSRKVLENPSEVPADRAAEAVRDFLSMQQPDLASRVEVRARGSLLVVECTGERPLATLRAVEGILGVEDRLPEVGDTAGLPEIEWEEEVVAAAEGVQATGRASDGEVLRSRVRYFPLPECEWFDIRQGILTLTEGKIVFQPEHRIPSVAGEGSKELVEIQLADITNFREDTWVHLRCLRIETYLEDYRFGRAAHRDKVELIFEVDDWLHALRNRLGKEE